MATVADIREDIKEDIADSTFTDDFIDRLINRALRKISSLVLLPSLEASDTVDTTVGSPYVDLPDGFGHNLFHASTSIGVIRVLSSMSLLLAEYPMFGTDDVDGPIEFCCLSGRQVAIQPVPVEVTTVRMFFHGWPPVLPESGNLDTYIDDEEAQESMVKHYVLARLHKRIEDGIEGPMRNTTYHEERFLAEVKAFSLTIKQSQSRPAPQRKPWGV